MNLSVNVLWNRIIIKAYNTCVWIDVQNWGNKMVIGKHWIKGIDNEIVYYHLVGMKKKGRFVAYTSISMNNTNRLRVQAQAKRIVRTAGYDDALIIQEVISRTSRIVYRVK